MTTAAVGLIVAILVGAVSVGTGFIKARTFLEVQERRRQGRDRLVLECLFELVSGPPVNVRRRRLATRLAQELDELDGRPAKGA